MFKKVLIANRGEIAVRIIRTCRDMGLATVAVFDETERDSLHVRLADECVALQPGQSLSDPHAVVQIAQAQGADAIHPGYGFLAERADFVQACEEAGITFIGPSSAIVRALSNKVEAMRLAESLGIATPPHSEQGFGDSEIDSLRAAAETLGYPLVIKSIIGGRGRGARLVRRPEHLSQAVRWAQAESRNVYGDTTLYLEHALPSAHQVQVQTLRDKSGQAVHLGEREGSIQRGNQKLIEEAPAPCLSSGQREKLYQIALNLVDKLDYVGIASVEFLVDEGGEIFFTEVKPRIQVEHPVTEMIANRDLVRDQIMLAAGEPLGFSQADVKLQGWSILCRVNAEDPWNNFLPSPGRLTRFRVPGGPGVRVDSYAYSGGDVPVRYDPLLAKLVVWDETREACVNRARRALEEFSIGGIDTNIPLLQRILAHPEIAAGKYTTAFLQRSMLEPGGTEADRRDLAVAAAIAFLTRATGSQPVMPERMTSPWHRDSRRLPG